MTLGEKIRLCRKRCSLSQEQLAEKMCVSRSAIAKWETDKGLPDIENIRMLSSILHISTDWLLDPQQNANNLIYRYSVDLSQYGKGCVRLRKDRCVRDWFPDAQISALMGRKDVTAGDAVAKDGTIARMPAHGCFLSTGTAADSASVSYYLVSKEDRQFFVAVTDAYIEYRLPEPSISGTEFTLNGMRFIRFAEVD